MSLKDPTWNCVTTRRTGRAFASYSMPYPVAEDLYNEPIAPIDVRHWRFGSRSEVGRDRVSPGGRRKLTLAGRAMAPKVSFRAPPRTHTGGQLQSVTTGCLRPIQCTLKRQISGDAKAGTADPH